VPHPSAPLFYPSAPSAYPGNPDIITKATQNDSGHGTDSATVSVTWNLTDQGAGSESISGDIGEFSAFTFAETGVATDTAVVSRTRPTLYPPPGPRIPQVAVPQPRLLLADTRTGRIHFELPYTKLAWSQKINKVGSATATIPLEGVLDAMSAQGADNPARVIWGFITGPLRYSLVVAYGTTVLWAGPLNPNDQIPADPSIDIGASEIASLLSGRLLTRLDGTGTWADASRDVNFLQTNPAGLMYSLVEFAIGKGPGYELPIYCTQPPEPLGTTNFNFLSYDQVDVLKSLQDQAAGEAGPDFRFDPFLYTGVDAEYLAYDLRIGNPYLDYGALWTWDDSTSRIAVSGDALGMASTLFATGSGQDRAKIIGAAQSNNYIDLGFPAVESVDSSRNSETDPDVLTSYATSAVAAQVSPTLTWSVSSLAHRSPQAGQFRVGDLAQIDVREHRLIDPGVYGSRIIALAGDETPWITSTLSMNEDDDTGSA
jgi:hypothetical protein